jgi:hypothetical protein
MVVCLSSWCSIDGIEYIIDNIMEITTPTAMTVAMTISVDLTRLLWGGGSMAGA